MTNGNEDDSLLLGNLPKSQRRAVRWSDGEASATCKFLRQPINLQEINQYEYRVAIRHENGTLTYVTPRGGKGSPGCTDRLSLKFGNRGPMLHIVGKTDNVISETAEFFINLEDPTDKKSFLRISSVRNTECYCAVQLELLRRIFEDAPSRELKFYYSNLTVEQSIILATRHHPVRLTFSECWIKDEGTAFVDALETRQSSFGSLTCKEWVRFSTANLSRLLQVDVIEHLSLSRLYDDKLALRAFSAKVNCLTYEVSSSLLSEIDSLDIVSKKLSLTIRHVMDTFPTEEMLSFFERVAALGHFVELDVRLHVGDMDAYPRVPLPDSVVQAIIRAAIANSNMEVLALNNDIGNFNGSQLVTLLKDIKDLKRLRVLIISTAFYHFEPGFTFLRELLSHNRNITVMNDNGYVYSDGPLTDNLYALNRFYRGSKGLLVKPPTERSSLVATALMEGASRSFQRSTLLLSDHADALHELVETAQLDDLDEGDPSSPSTQDQKRQRRT